MNNKKYSIDFFCWTSHHFEHLLPVWEALPNKNKGIFYISTHLQCRDDFKVPESMIVKEVVDMKEAILYLNKDSNLLLIPTIYEKTIMKIKRPICLISHGAGQTYITQQLSPFRKNVVMDILPNEFSGTTFKERYPDSNISVVGSPKMDKWHKNPPTPNNDRPVIAISFHHNRSLVPETKSAWLHYKNALKILVEDERWEVLGHGHPYMIDELIPTYKKLEIEVVKNFDDVLNRADLYICDHMSTLYEFASTSRPVVVLNAPWYRRNVEHGLRFWEHADVGVNCNEPEDLIASVEDALIDNIDRQKSRRKAVDAVFAVNDGGASNKAVEALVDYINSETYLAASYRIANKSLGEGYPGIYNLLSKDIKRGHRVLIYGAGEHTEKLLNKMKADHFQIEGLIDKDSSKIGKKIMGYPVYSTKQIKDLNPTYIIISSQTYEKEIYHNLLKLNIEAEIYPIYYKNKHFEKNIMEELYFSW